jgi:tRNA (guanine-N7-)-methyltransferase
MKPKNLKYPFTWENRKPAIVDRVLFVPDYYELHQEWTFPGWDHPDLFGKQGKVHIEYCAGNGAWIIEKARQSPDILWVAVEKRFDRVRKIWSKMRNLEIPNLVVVSGEALTFTRNYLASDTIDAIYVNFPDPWPKEKHAKHRLIQAPFAQEIARVVKASGTATFVTDHVDYCKQMIDTMSAGPLWKSAYQEPFYITEMEDYGTSYFDDLWRKKGFTIHYLNFINQKSS